MVVTKISLFQVRELVKYIGQAVQVLVIYVQAAYSSPVSQCIFEVLINIFTAGHRTHRHSQQKANS